MNVWFDSFFQTERFKEIINSIVKIVPEIICLQECNQLFITTLVNDSRISRSYYISDIDGKTLDTWYGVVILVKKSLHLISFQKMQFPTTRMGRSLLTARLSIAGKLVVVGSSHFESGIEDWNVRQEQLTKSTDFLNADACFLCGDFNVYDDDLETKFLLSLGWNDPWLMDIEKSKDDIERNGVTFGHIIKAEKGYPRRLDRILYKSLAKPIKIETINNQKLNITGFDVYPSDHFGLLTNFEI